ncbi:MAG TPA: TetR/AcrR family transcriptional regulator C-terminal domain-containing protein [Terriglobales bacterium]
MSSTRNLSREKIAAAALAIADAEGFACVSMRRVAQQLRAGTMSLYYYVRTKAELIAAMDDALMAEVVAPSLPRDWRKALTMIALRTRDVFIRHPWALASMQSAPPGVNAMRHMEQCLEVLSGTGMSTQDKLTLLAVIDDFVFGYALRETAGDPDVDVDLARKQLATGAFPRLAEVFGEGRVCAMPNRFRLGLEALLNSAAKRTIAPAAHPRVIRQK